MNAFSRSAGGSERYRLSNSASVSLAIRVGVAVSVIFSSCWHSIALCRLWSPARAIRPLLDRRLPHVVVTYSPESFPWLQHVPRLGDLARIPRSATSGWPDRPAGKASKGGCGDGGEPEFSAGLASAKPRPDEPVPLPSSATRMSKLRRRAQGDKGCKRLRVCPKAHAVPIGPPPGSVS
jgi:hypothetical protein